MFKKSHTHLTQKIAINKGDIYYTQINLASITGISTEGVLA